MCVAHGIVRRSGRRAARGSRARSYAPLGCVWRRITRPSRLSFRPTSMRTSAITPGCRSPTPKPSRTREACVDEAVARDARVVSERVTDGLSGHDGEWLSVRAGALGRALVLGLDDEAADAGGGDRRRARPRAAGVRGSPRRRRAGHDDAGARDDDRSQPRRLVARRRCVAAAPPRASELHARYSRLGHADGAAASRRLPARGRAQQGAHGDREPSVPRAAQAACAAPQPLVAAARRPVVRRVG